jgi:octaprenyl-diphosphate synthase
MTALQQKQDQTQSPLDILQERMAVDMKAVNQMILENMRSDVPLIPQLASYLIAAGGKRIRPLLTLTTTALFDGDMTRAHRLAAAVEFIHTATLLHDDVVDDSDQRRGKDSANIVFGNEASVLVGDFLFSRAFQLMVADGSLDILRVLSNASAIIAEGEVLQLSAQNNLKTSMNDYLAIIEGKTASLFAAACEVGPLIRGEDKNTVNHIREFGMNLGMAFQIIDDVLDYRAERAKLGKTIGDDFREGKMTAPIIMALEKATKDEKAFWQRTLGDKDQRDSDLQTAQELIAKYNTLEQSTSLAKSYGERAISNLAILPATSLKSTLTDLVHFTINRDH